MELLITRIMAKSDLKELIDIFNKKVRMPNDKKNIPTLEESETPIL